MIAGGGLAVETAIRYGVQIADALGHAHERELLHRDLKSSNVMVTKQGRIKVLDFGLAKRMGREPAEETRTQEALTDKGTVIGTLAYMAPETLRGEPADARSDLWALGVILHEMLLGARPFQGTTAYALSAAILQEPAAPLPDRTPSGVRGVIQKCLAKEPGQRYQSVVEVRAALETMSSGAVVVGAPEQRGWYRWAVVIAALAVAAIGTVWWLKRGTSAGRIESIQSVAVLPFDNFSKDPEQEFFADGMTEQFIQDLSKIRALRVISRTSVMQYRGTRKPLPQIARELGVDAVVEGSVMRSGN